MSRLAAMRQRVVVDALKLAAQQMQEETGSGHQDADLDMMESLLDSSCHELVKELPK